MPATTLSILVGKKFVCLKVTGRANFAASPDFKTVLEELAQKNYQHFVIDLTGCALMDSTYLGVLAGFGLRLKAAVPNGPGIKLHNANERIRELLESLGADQLFQHTEGELRLPDEVTATCTPDVSQPTREEMTRTSLEAHRTLMDMNPENVARFKDVAQFLAEDLRCLENAKND